MNPVGNNQAHRRGCLGWADVLTCVALDQITFTPAHRTLFIGAVPTRLAGIAALRGHVDVVDPRHERTRLLQQAVPGARIIRSFLADAIPRLSVAYDVVLSGDPTDVAGPWTWTETFDAIQRVAAPATHGACFVRLDPLGESDIAGRPDAPRAMVELQDVADAAAQIRALEFPHPPPRPSVLAYDPDDPEASAWAATFLATHLDDIASPVDAARRVHARLSLGPMGSLAPAALVGKSVELLPRAVVIGEDSLTPLISGPTSALDVGPGAVPLKAVLAMALARGQMAEARHLIRQYARLAAPNGEVPCLSSCLRTGEAQAVIALSPHPHVQDARTAVRRFCEGLIGQRSDGTVMARYSDASMLVEALLPSELAESPR